MTMTSDRPPNAKKKTEGDTDGAAKWVLIVDDHADERAIQRAMLEHVGYRVVEAADGESALELAREAGPDLILLDIAMPKMDGLTVCRELRQDPRTARAVILFYTASVVDEVEEQVREAGGSGVLMKPIDPHQVAAAVKDLIGPPDSAP